MEQSSLEISNWENLTSAAYLRPRGVCVMSECDVPIK